MTRVPFLIDPPKLLIWVLLIVGLVPDGRADVVRPLPFDLLYVRSPYYGDGYGGEPRSRWTDVTIPLDLDPGARLIVLRTDGTREVLFPLEHHRSIIDTPKHLPLDVGSVSDPEVSFDGEWVLFAWYHDLTDVNPQRDLSRKGADLYKLNLVTGDTVRLTDQELTPNTGNGADFSDHDPYSNHPQIGVFNVGGTWAPGGKIVYTSTRNNYLAPRSIDFGQRNMQLTTMHDDGTNKETIGFLNLAMALHPRILMDGRVAFSSWESQGLRDIRNFALWAIAPDGRSWTSLSGYTEGAHVHHFMTQMPDGSIVVCRYYNFNNNGFGDLLRYPIDPPGPDFLTSDPDPETRILPFQRKARVNLTPWTTGQDFPSPCPGYENDPYASARSGVCANEARRGKVTHPQVIPPVSGIGKAASAELLVSFTAGPANHNGIYVSEGIAWPWYRGEIRMIPDGEPMAVPPPDQPGPPSEASFPLVLREDDFNLHSPRPVVSYEDIYGMREPVAWPQRSDQEIREDRLVPGEPFGLVGSSSVEWRETLPARNLYMGEERDPFNASRASVWGWLYQGADSGLYDDDELYAVRVLMQIPSTDRTYPNNRTRFGVVGNERLRILGEIPVRKRAPLVPHPDGIDREDTSFLAKIPADVSFTFQSIDRRGMSLNVAQTWHQVRPGESRFDCGGCHSHSYEPLDFALTAASKPNYRLWDLANKTPLISSEKALSNPSNRSKPRPAERSITIEYRRDIEPLLDTHCASCHDVDNPAAGLVLSSEAPPVLEEGIEWPGSYYRLVRDTYAQLGPPPPSGGTWQQPQLTYYMRAFQSRQSLLMWKLWGERLDGRTNGSRGGDIDYARSPAHPDGVGLDGLPEQAKMTFARWIDLGAPIDLTDDANPNWGFLEDDTRPTLVFRPSVETARLEGGVQSAEISAFDVESGLDPVSLEVIANIDLGSVKAGDNLASDVVLSPDGQVATLELPRFVSLVEELELTVRVRDRAGHETTIRRSYRLP